MEELSCAGFTPHVGSRFRVGGLPAEVDLLLADVQDQSGPPIEGKRHECFTLVFRGPLEPSLEQGTYRMEHPELGPLFIFIVPVATVHTDGRRYEAVFNRYV